MTAREDLELEQTLERVFDPAAPLELRQGLLARLRQGNAESVARVDQAVLRRDQSHTEAIAGLVSLLDELRATCTRLTSAPLNEAVYVESCAQADGRRLARVVTHGSRETLVELADEAILPMLRPGDRVLLSTQGNVVLAKSETGSAAPGECAVVERWMDARRLVLRHRDQSVVVRAAADLTPDTVKEGESVRVDPLSGFAMERVPSDAKSLYAASDQSTSLPPEALAGYDDIRDRTLRRITYAVAHPELAAQYGMQKQRPWILLGGPPGLGKSTLARVVAGDLHRHTGRRCKILKVNGGELLSSWVGETEQRIKALVREVRDSDEWSILFIDEAEAIARTRGVSGNVHGDRFLNTWLAELEGFDGKAPCILIAATNRIDMLDAAFRSRFATEIEFPRPRMVAARAIFGRHLPAELPFHPGDDGAARTRSRLIDAAVAKLYLPNAPGALLATLRFRDGKTRPVYAVDLISGRLIEQICVEAREHAFRRHVEGDPAGLRIDDMEAAVESARKRLRTTLTPSNAHSHLSDLPQDVAVVAVDPAPRVRSGVTFIHEAAR